MACILFRSSVKYAIVLVAKFSLITAENVYEKKLAQSLNDRSVLYKMWKIPMNTSDIFGFVWIEGTLAY